MEGYQQGSGRGRREGTENKQYKLQVENRQGEVKSGIGNGEAKELICMIHRHELKGVNAGGRGCTGWRGIQGGWIDCNSIKNKIYLKIKIKEKRIFIQNKNKTLKIQK